jgi:NAD+ synthetase
MDPEVTVKKIRTELKNYIIKSNLKSLVLGLSGGIDSSLCAALAKPVCDELNIPLIGRSITIETNKNDEIERGITTGASFCHDYKEVNLTDLYLQIQPGIEEEKLADDLDIPTRIRLGNIKARMRMIYLYNLAQKFGGLVLSTDNYTEYLLGFWTLHGDVGDYGMIQNLWKTEVYEVSKYIVENELEDNDAKDSLQSCIDAIPTDGLGITNSDLDQLKAGSYYEVDQILKEFLSDGSNADHPVIQRHKGSAYKRNNPLNLKREEII